MKTSGPRAAGLFFYECVRLLLLVILLGIAPWEGAAGGILPCYLGANALFPLAALFVWLKPEEYGNYLTLHIAGKVVVLVSFLVWEIFSSQGFMGQENLARSIVLLAICVFLNLADIFSVWLAWAIKSARREARGRQPVPAGFAEKGDL